MNSNKSHVKTTLNLSEWSEKAVKDIAEIVGGGTPSTKISEYWNGNIPWITPKDLSMQQRKYICKGLRNITIDGLNKSSAKIIPLNSIILSTRAPIGYIAISKRDITTNQGCHSLIPSDGTDTEFLYYLILNNVNYLKSQSNGSTFDELSAKVLSKLEFALPNLKEQKAIAKILSDLDSKIELNEKMNKTLEAIAQAIFKHWFIDFEFPDEEGKPYKSSGGEMVDSGLGKIPKRWTVEVTGNIINAVRGVSYRSNQLKASKNALVTLKSIKRGGGFTKAGFKPYSGDYKNDQVLNSKDIIIAFTDLTQLAEVIGRPAMVVETDEYRRIIPSMDIGIIKFKDNFPFKFFIYQLMKSESFHSHLLGYVNGTTVLHLSNEGVRT